MTAGEPQVQREHGRRRALVGGAIAFAVALLVGLPAWRLAYPYGVGPQQPLPFSHRVHAGDKQISCLFCHPYADRAPYAGLPATGECLLCHDKIIPDFPPIQDLKTYYRNGEPIPWVRVYRLPDFAHFDHRLHLRQGIDCGRCHGDVKAMDRIFPNERIRMGFCIDCHRQKQASTECFRCHY